MIIKITDQGACNFWINTDKIILFEEFSGAGHWTLYLQEGHAIRLSVQEATRLRKAIENDRTRNSFD